MRGLTDLSVNPPLSVEDAVISLPAPEAAYLPRTTGLTGRQMNHGIASPWCYWLAGDSRLYQYRRCTLPSTDIGASGSPIRSGGLMQSPWRADGVVRMVASPFSALHGRQRRRDWNHNPPELQKTGLFSALSERHRTWYVRTMGRPGVVPLDDH